MSLVLKVAAVGWSTATMSREMILPLCSAQGDTSGAVWFWTPQYETDMERVQQRTTRIVQALEHPSNKER